MRTTFDHANHELVASLYKRYYGALLTYMTSYTHDVMAAEDMLQELFLKVMSLDILVDSTAKGLLFVMARRMIVDDARHRAFANRGTRAYALTVSLYDTSTPVGELEAQETLKRGLAVLERMPARRALIYKMYRGEELSAREIATRLHISRRTVETHIYLSTKEMKRWLRTACGE